MKHIIALIALICTTAHAAPDYATFGGVSYHFTQQGKHAKGKNETNAGIGATWSNINAPIIGSIDVSAGLYHNSESRTSTYITASKLPYEFAYARWGVTAGIASGYSRNEIRPIIAPTACWKYACVMIAPPVKGHNAGVAMVQFRTPL